jgi:hypothetical protein
MRIGVVFPQTELGGDASAVRAYGQRVEELGFTHLLAYDHVIGADREDITHDDLVAACTRFLQRTGWTDGGGEIAEMMAEEAAETADQ